MLLRFWGEARVVAEDFASLVDPARDGIRAQVLTEAVRERGWTGVLVAGTQDAVSAQLARGRPILALLRVGADAHHYVVVIAWANGWVIVHDPNVGPFRALREDRFLDAWSGGERWALLVLPPQTTGARTAASDDAPIAAVPYLPDACAMLIAEGVLLADEGEVERAEESFLAAQALCPTSASPLRERAGLRFRAEDWENAGTLAERALALDPADALAWRLLAGSRFLAHDTDGALDAWNHLSEPRNDLTRIDGLTRTRYAAAHTQLDLPTGQLVTSRAFRRAGRRLAELPSSADARLSLRPLPDGLAQVNVVVWERPLVSAGRWDLARAGTRALLDRELKVDVASPTRNGELWSAAWRWWAQRPRVSLALTAPAAGGRPGIWRVEGSWERQTYGTPALDDAEAGTLDTSGREERRRTSVSFADWLGPDLRLEITTALDGWKERGTHLALEAGLEARFARDRVSASATIARWQSLDGRTPFTAAEASVHGLAGGMPGYEQWQVRMGLASASASAPLALWSGAGTGYGRDPLLRAHPLLVQGTIDGKVFGRTLAHATLQRQSWPWHYGPARIGWAIFVDGAKPWNTGQVGSIPLQVDGGVGLRLRSLGMKGGLRVDVARGFTDGNLAGSIAWQLP